MKKSLTIIITSILFLSFVMPALALAHSGRTDSSGGHNCSAKSQAKGLCTGYHYHNGGSSSSGSSSSSSSSSSVKITKQKSISNEYPPQAHCKKVKDVYQSSDTYYNYYERVWDCNFYADNGLVFTHLDLSFYVNNNYQSLNAKLISIKNTTYISVRDFSQAFGYSLAIDKAGDINLSKSKTTIKIFKANDKIFLNGKATDVKAVKADGYYYIPLRSALSWANGKIDSIDNQNLYVSIK
ncbi:copper amine oxidase N-terminal domain-containing protein [Paenibacillus sinopodophylli]|uniref:copper amine oxidase N-terminal domain-containing protein n=1 Tax=Paenibacillus sinopodophylli TaxID=1837342 RepID=UPI00110CF45F|nr:copper amine oxidase N-terminal domain-containing protein [Paenibacillus sinopodophylli]